MSALHYKRQLELSTDARHVIRADVFHLTVRLPIDPSDSETWNDRYTLVGNGPGGELSVDVKTVLNDQQPGDDAVDLRFLIWPDWSYSLRIEQGDGIDPYFLFKERPFSQLNSGG